MKSKFWNIPNILSIIRLVLVPVMLLCFFLIPGENHWAAMIVFVVASLTDALDGFIARSTHQITQYGIVLDPLADKLLKVSTLIAFAIEGILPVWLVSVLAFIDIGMIVTGFCLYNKKITIPSNLFGKLGTLVVSAGLLMCFFPATFSPWNLYIMYIGMVIVIASLLIYILLNYKRVFCKKGKCDDSSLEEQTVTPKEENSIKVEQQTTPDTEIIENDTQEQK